MGQLILIQSGHPATTDALWSRTIPLIEGIAGIRPCGQVQQGRLRAAKFPKHAVVSSGFCRDASSGRWIAGAGTWFYERVSGCAALENLCRDWGGEDVSNAVLERLDGSFVLIAGRTGDGGFSVITDRVGTLHAFVCELEGALAVCTSSLVLASLSRAKWDELSCREFLATGTVFEHRTLFRGIEKLGPATMTHFPGRGRRVQRKYWDVGQHMFDRAPREGTVDGLAEALEQAVGTVIGAYPNAVFDLTGGFDSRAVLAAALRTGAPVATVVNGPEDSPDVTAANRIAAEFALDHRHQERKVADPWEMANRALPLCDGEYNVLEYAGTLSAHLGLVKDHEASVNGSNGEICKGYWWELLLPHIGSKGYFDSRVVASRRFLFDSAGADLLDVRGEVSLLDHFARLIDRANQGLDGYPNTALMDNVYLTVRMQRWQGRIASATSRIWPCASPFMFRQVMETALAAPAGMRVRHRMMRRLIEQLNPRLAALPLAQGYPALPLRLGTAHRFWALAVEAAGGLKRRIPRPLASVITSSSGPQRSRPPAICETGGFRDIMQPSRMKSGSLYDRRKLSAFLAEAGSPQFSAEPQLGRVLTLELLARCVNTPLAAPQETVRV